MIKTDNRGSSRRGLVLESLTIYCDFILCINIILCIIQCARKPQGYLVIKTDNRGSSRRGLVFEAPIKGDMGRLEVDDQVGKSVRLVLSF